MKKSSLFQLHLLFLAISLTYSIQSNCKTDAYKCTSTIHDDQVCISKDKKCDGLIDCKYGDDETDCDLGQSHYSITDFLLNNPNSFLNSPIKLRINDTKSCPRNMVYCTNKFKNYDGCIHLSSICNSDFDEFCDNLDELEFEIVRNLCVYYKLSQEYITFECGYNFSISYDLVCDGMADCINGADEAFLVCGKGFCEFKCMNNQCSLNTNRCDGIDQCVDGSDELSCQISSTSKYDCDKKTEFECINKEIQGNTRCISLNKTCDSIRDCRDGSDEWPSLCKSRSCDNQSEYFKCEWNGACIGSDKQCDGIVDCVDYSDEKDCFNANNTSNTEIFHCGFKCNNNTCITIEQICDHNYDCLDHEDEATCNYTLCSSSARACGNDTNAICKVLPHNRYNCDCKSGFTYDTEHKYCRDINECEFGKCSQLCINKIGTYECDCFEGFVLKNGHCLLNQKQENYLEEFSILYSDYNRIFKLNKNTHHVELLFQYKSYPFSNFIINDFVYSFQNDLLFFTDLYTTWIYMYSTQSKVTNKLFNTNDIKILSNNTNNNQQQHSNVLLAYDWIHKNIYFTSNNSIYILGPIVGLNSNSLSHKLTVQHVIEPRTLIVSPVQKSIYWTDLAYGTIESAYLDGTKRKTIVKDLKNPQAVTIDFSNNRLYWFDTEHRYIGSCDLNGGNLNIKVNNMNHEPASMTLFENNIYYIYDNILNQISLSQSKPFKYQKLINRLIQVNHKNTIHIYNAVSQPEYMKNLCNCKGCLCIPPNDMENKTESCYCELSAIKSNLQMGFVLQSSLNETLEVKYRIKHFRNLILTVSLVLLMAVSIVTVVSMIRQIEYKPLKKSKSKSVRLIYHGNECSRMQLNEDLIDISSKYDDTNVNNGNEYRSLDCLTEVSVYEKCEDLIENEEI